MEVDEVVCSAYIDQELQTGGYKCSKQAEFTTFFGGRVCNICAECLELLRLQPQRVTFKFSSSYKPEET